MLPCVSVKHFLHVFLTCALQDQICSHNPKFQLSYGICIRKKLKITRTMSRSNVRRETLKTPRQPRGQRSETKQKFKSDTQKKHRKLLSKAARKSHASLEISVWQNKLEIKRTSVEHSSKKASKRGRKKTPNMPHQPRRKHSKTYPKFEREIGTKYVHKFCFLDPEKPHQPRGQHLKKSLGYTI